MIKSIVEKKELVVEYPCIKISNHDLIVLFSDVREGVVLAIGSTTNTIYKIGYYSHEWCESEFESFNGEITLSNEKS